MKRKILFIAEAVTLAHVARPLALSAVLDPSELDLSIACTSRYHWLLSNFPGETHPLDSVDSAHFLAALARGQPLYDEAILHRYVRADLALLEKIRPDVVVSDFRLSLSVSARLAGIPYVTISNCYWSPYWRPQRYPIPNLPITRILPLPLADLLFQIGRPLAFALHCRPLNRVRRHYGLPTLGYDLRHIYTDADHVLYADVPELFPHVQTPAHHHFLGPILWSPPVPVPSWWTTLPEGSPLIYVALGSSGQAQLLPQVLEVLSHLDVIVMASTAGITMQDQLPDNAYAAPYLPGDSAARRATLVICNGGSPTNQQALAAGVPVIGIAGNLDQFLSMGTIERVGAGKLVRADRFDPKALRRLVKEVLGSPDYRAAAVRVSGWFSRFELKSEFSKILTIVFGDESSVKKVDENNRLS